MVYVDESGLEESIRREYARAPKGKPAEADITGKRSQRTSIIAGLNQGEPLAPLYFTGYCNTEVILSWVQHVLIPELKPGQTVIWDNATFHQSPEIRTLIESADCKLLFLPAYSPDLNPIEHYWAKLKAWIRRFREDNMTIPEALCKFFQKAQ